MLEELFVGSLTTAVVVIVVEGCLRKEERIGENNSADSKNGSSHGERFIVEEILHVYNPLIIHIFFDAFR